MVNLLDNNAMGLPLKGKRIVVTRARNQAQPLCERLESLGATVLELPLIKVSPHCDTDTLDDVFSEIAQYEMLVFTSPNGVRHFFNFFFNHFQDIRCIGGARLAAIGPSTASALQDLHLQVDVIPTVHTAEALAESILNFESLDNEKVLLITGNLNRDILLKTLEEQGRAIVDICQVYKTEKADLSNDAHAQDFRGSGADAVIFASSSAVSSFIDQAQSLQLDPSAQKPLTCSIGPQTSETMRDHSLPVDIQAKEHSLDGIIQALIKHFK